MAAPTLVIGVGGTGVRALVRVKERLLEAYDQVPPEIILFELDTDDYKSTREDEAFNGVTLTVVGDRVGDRPVGPHEAEFYHVTTRDANMTLDNLKPLKAKGDPAWQWINEERIRATLTTPESRVIAVGARTVRPVGRSALFLDYGKVYGQIQDRLDRVIATQIRHQEDAGNEGDGNLHDDRKATVFVVCSVAGGSGAGMGIDILRMIQHMRSQGERRAAPISVMALLVGGSAFTGQPGDRTDSNTFAALRELDRLGAVAGRALNTSVPPVMWAPAPVGRFTTEVAPADMILLFDRPDRNQRERDVPKSVPNAYLSRVVAPTLADLIVAFMDERIVAAMRTVRADMGEKWQRKDPHNETPGHFPYASAGLHTLIFPERDVRRSAGLRLLLELWDDYLVRPEEAGNRQLPPATRELWGEDLGGLGSLSPQIFTDRAFQRDPVCKGAANNNFIQMVVTSAVNEHITLPSARGFLGFGTLSMVRRVVALIGVPNSSQSSRGLVERVAERLESQIDRSIDELERYENATELKNWRRKYIGEGALGSEKGGLWELWFREAESIRGHRDDFADVLRNVVAAILNDAEPTVGRRIAYRLEYAEQVLDRLEQHIRRLTQGDPKHPNRGSLLSEYFTTQERDEATVRQVLSRLEPDAMRGESLRRYQKSNRDYARRRRELVGLRMLELLCQDLLEVVESLREALVAWQTFLRTTRRQISELQTRHEENRLAKSSIPVRTYLSEAPSPPARNFKDGAFERDLYARHHDAAIDGFLKTITWEWRAAHAQYHLEAPFGKSDDPTLDEHELVERAVNWACTRQGNPDRPDIVPPLRDLASTSEVNMAVRIRDFFGTPGLQRLVTRLTSDAYLASLCPLNTWPRRRLMYALGLPRTAPSEDEVGTFFNDVVSQIEHATTAPAFDERRPMIYNPENPRHAVAAEFAVGFKLQHRTDQEEYASAYWTDTNNRFALHCLPEEDRASTYYELAFTRDNHLYGHLGRNHMILDPAVVDVLGDRHRLELFVKAVAIGKIDLLGADQRSVEGADFYLWPTASANKRIRLSKMDTVEEVRDIARDLVPTEREVNAVVQNRRAVNRLRMMYALRTFVLLEHKVDDRTHLIPYEDLENEIDKEIRETTLEARLEAYTDWRDGFLQYYVEHRDQYPMLAHLGLVLARVADDLRESEQQKGV